MLRITVHSEKTQVTLELEGRLAGAWVAELQRAWQEALTGGRSIVVNLAAVSYVDADGKRLLSDMCRAGATFEASGCLMRCLVHEMTRACHGNAAVESGNRDEGHHGGT
jgi:ABC-type transporter Mla MlaB component